MSARARIALHMRFAFALLAALLATFCYVAQAQPPESTKKPADAKPGSLPAIKLLDGTYLWTGTPTDGNGERVILGLLQELQKLQDQIEQSKKQAATTLKPSSPSECSIRGRIEKQGEQLVAVLKLNYAFRTTASNTAIALGGRKAFPVSASLDGNKLPILETTDEGFAATIETAGEHKIALEFQAPISARGVNAKTEIGFEIGLPRSAITTFTLEPPSPDVKRVNLTTRITDPAQPTRPPDRRVLDIKQLTPRPDQEKGPPLGPIESLEVTWEPPAAVAQPADQVQSADFDISVLFTEAAVESTAKIKLRGPARQWRLIAPINADVTVDRASATAEVGPMQLPTPTKPTDPNRPVWKIDLPGGTSSSDWVITVVTRQTRRADDPKSHGPYPIGPFTVLDVLRQTGTVRVTGSPHTYFSFKHGMDLRQTIVPGPAEDDVPTAFFRWTTGPTGTTPPNQLQPLFNVEVFPQVGSIVVKPTYKLTLEKIPLTDDYVWRIRAEVRIIRNHVNTDALAIEIPSDWSEGAEASFPSESLPGIALGVKPEGFWSSLASKQTKGVRVPATLQLPTGQKQAIDLILTANIRVPAGLTKLSIPLPRFPKAFERDVAILASVPEGLEFRESEARSLDGVSTANRGIPLSPLQTTNTKPNKNITAVKGESDSALSQLILGWNAQRPDMTAEINADVLVTNNQTQISEVIKLRSVDGLPRIIRFRPAHNGVVIAGLKATKGQLINQPGHLEWTFTPPPETKEATLEFSYAIPHDRRQAEQSTWNLPIGIIWPVGSTQTETTVRIWSNATSSRKISNLSMDWRELPAEAVPNRDVIPSLVLAASTGELPLVIEAREINEASTLAVWVDRASIQAWGAEDGATHYRAKFLLHRWLGASIEIRLPKAVEESKLEFLRDGLKIMEATPIHDPSGTDRLYRLPLDSFSGKSITLEVRYQIASLRGEIGEVLYLPVAISNAAFAGPIRWQITVPHGQIPLLTSGATTEFHWRLFASGLLPVPLRSSEDDHFTEGSSNPQEDAITARQGSPAPIVVYRFPRIGFVIVCSVIFFLAFLLLIRLHASAIGPIVAAMGLLTGISAIFLPHPSAQIAGACQPGLALGVVVLLIQATIRSYYRHRSNHLPGFARVALEPSGPALPLPSSTRSRPSGFGSVGATPVAPAGG